MIETITINGREIPLSLNADSITLPEGRPPPFYAARALGRVGKKYHTQSEGFMFFDTETGISLAAQLVQWIDTKIQPGRHHVYLPGDHLVYAATIQVQKTYILVENEELIEFQEALERIRKSPANSQINDSGRLSQAFIRHQIETVDLFFDLDPGKNNPFYLTRGYSITEYGLLGAAILGAILPGVLLFNLFQENREAEAPPPLAQIIKPASVSRLHTDLAALERLLTDFTALLAYELKDVRIQKTGAGYNTIATGNYRQSYSLARLHQLAGKLGGVVTVREKTWTLRSNNAYRPPAGAQLEPAPLAGSLETYRQLANSNGIAFAIQGVTRQRHHANGKVKLDMRHPNRTLLRRLRRQMEGRDVPGLVESALVSATSHAAWERLSLIVDITGR